MTNWQAMQAAESTIDGKKERRAPGDCNIKQMSMGSWKASLSKGGQARGLKGINHGTNLPVKGKK